MYSVQNVLKTVRENSGQLGVVETRIRQAMQISIDVASEVIERKIDEFPIDDKLSDVRELMSGYVKLENDIVQFKAAVEELCGTMTDVPEDSAQLLKETYERLRSASPDVESHVFYKELLKVIDAGFNSAENVVPQTQEGEEEGREDEDLVLTEQDSVPIDPFTKREVTDPIRNTVCNHIYEKSSIIQYMNNNPGRKLKCPISGCSSTARLTEQILEEDDELRRSIRRKKKAVGLLMPS